MSSLLAVDLAPEDDVHMRDPDAANEEGEGDALMPGASDDSSDEEEDDPEEEQRIKDGFIVSEEEDDDGEEDEEERRRRRKRRRKHRKQREEEELDDDDLDLITESTGRPRKNRLTRLKRRYSKSPPVASSSRRPVVESSDEDLGDEPRAPDDDIHNIWDDDDRQDEDEDGDADMDDFIEEDEEEGGMGEDEHTREARRKAKRRELEERRKKRGVRTDMVGIDANAWDEMHDVFGDGHDYDWALEKEEELGAGTNEGKEEMRYADVFEPSEMRAKLLTEDDEIIRGYDRPERMQLETAAIHHEVSLATFEPLTEKDMGGAAMWVTQRLSDRKAREFFAAEGDYFDFKGQLVMAVTNTMKDLFEENLEVPFIWTHKRDYIIHYDNSGPERRRIDLLSLSDLWKIYTLGHKYRSLVNRRNALIAHYERQGSKNQYFEDEIVPNIDGLEVVADATEWLSMMMHKDKNSRDDFRFHDDDEEGAADSRPKHKAPSRVSVYEVTKKSIVSKLADKFGIKPHEVVSNYQNQSPVHFIDNPDLNPAAQAEQYADSDPTKAQPAEELLRQARLILVTELGKDPLLRRSVRQAFKEEAVVSVAPTERGKIKIDEHHAYFNFKYLHEKPIRKMMNVPQFLRILEAEKSGLVTVNISLPMEARSMLERRLMDAFTSDSFDESAKAWNEERARVVHEVFQQHLLPTGAKWTREYLRDEVEDYIAASCATIFRERVDVAPYRTSQMEVGETASVMAISWGKGDPQRDDICIVFLDERGRLREHTKIANLYDTEMKDELFDILKRRRPDVIVVGGLTMSTSKLSFRLKEVLKQGPDYDHPREDPDPDFAIPVTYVRDEVARIYQHSARAAEEFAAFSEVEKYCVGLARYTQNPLNEYAALGADVGQVAYYKDDQLLAPPNKLLLALERVLVDVTNKVGVDINRCVSDNHYRHLLPFVCGLGPRKAEDLIQKIQSQGGSLSNRRQLLRAGLLMPNSFMNAAGFLRISQDAVESKKSRAADDNEDESRDPLDDTRIHPSDYDLARKMATDALELDEEDTHDDHPSAVVRTIMHDPDRGRKLAELNLDEFAVSLEQANNELKRHTLNIILAELQAPFSEQRAPWTSIGDWDVLEMLSGENEATLSPGLIVSAYVVRSKDFTANLRLDSGVDAIVQSGFMSTEGGGLKVGTTVPGLIIEVKLDKDHDQFLVELSTTDDAIQEGDRVLRRILPDTYWDRGQHERDTDMLARKKRAETASNRRIIKHPNFHNFNTAQAEAYLEKQQRGDVVIRPSSKGHDHLAVTWKVDNKVYQHIDVTEISAPGQGGGSQLMVDANHIYSDLDELIVNHVQSMVRRVEDLMNHERYKAKSEDELHAFLKQQLAANPAKSMYGFTLNRKKPGHFILCFLANKQTAVQSWPVRVTPEAYYLFEAAAPGVAELCDAFKVRHLHQQNVYAQGGRTPYGAGGRTPARHGGATPGYASVRQSGATPSFAAPRYGGTTPAANSFGYQTPSHSSSAFVPPPPPSAARPGIHPGRAAMIEQANRAGGGWGS